MASPSATPSATAAETDASATGASTITSAPTRTSTASASSSSSSSRAPQVHTVKAGSGGFKYEPAELTDVAVGDTVTFEFYPPDHSVARAEFMSPCVPYEYTGKDKVGFWSETQYVDTVQDLKYWNITVNSTEPIFFYCAAPDSCIGHKMVGVINPNETFTLDAQIQAAGDSTFQVKPGDPIPAEGTATLHATATSSPTSAASSGHSDSHKLSGGAIAGIVIGAVAFLAICAALFFYIGRTKSLKEMMHRRDATVAKSTGHDGGNYPQSHPGSPGFPPTPFSPNHNQAEYGGQLPAYGQHNATDQYPSGYMSPTMTPGHMSMSGSPQPQMAEVKQDYQAPVEMASPTPGQQNFTAELEAPIKSPRG